MAEYGSFGTTALKLDIGTEYSSLGPGLADLYGPFGDTVGKLVGQYSDSDRVSHSLQILSRKSERLKSHESREGRERIHSASSERGGDWLGACESLRTIDSASESHCGDRAPRRGGGELTHR